MASYTINSGELSVHDKQLTASAVDTVTFTDQTAEIEVLSDGAAALYFTVQPGITPTVSGPHTYKLPAGSPSSLRLNPPSSGSVAVKLISPGTPTYSVSSL